jgi:hypothetical protein
MSRPAVCAVLFAASCLFVTLRAEPAAAQDKKEKDKIAALEKQIAALKQELAQSNQQNAALKQENANLKAALKKATAAPPPDATLKSLQATIDSYRGAGLVHVVVLKLKSDSSSGEVQSVIDDTYSQLAKIKTVRAVWAGKPSAKGTPDVAATDYTVALVFLFDDAAGLKTYLNDSVHTKFADKHLKLWETPVIYDFEPKKLAPAPADPNATTKSLQAIIDGYRGAGLVHTVVLKLKTDSAKGEPQSVIDDTYAQLSKISAVRGVWAGKPASKATPDASTDYTVALVLLFDDADGLKSYLNDPVHTKFADNHLKKWETPVVYDFEPKAPSP